jgi:hypothetical protein
MILEFSRQDLEKSNMKFHENPSSESRVVLCGRTDERTGGQTDRRTDMTTLIVAFRNFENVPKNKKKRENLHTNKCGNAREHECPIKAAGKKVNKKKIYMER